VIAKLGGSKLKRQVLKWNCAARSLRTIFTFGA
jgi:hypothetical protein